MACHFARGVEVAHVLRNYLGRATGPTQGRDGNMHFGARERNSLPARLDARRALPVTVGAALAFKRRSEPRVALTFFGDGTMSTGDVHEGLNLAAVLQVPAVFVLQNNGYAYSTPIGRQMTTPTWPSASRRAGASPPSASTAPTRCGYASVLGAIERARRRGPRPSKRSRCGCTVTRRTTTAATWIRSGCALRRAARPVERLAARLRLDGLSEADRHAAQAAVDEVAGGLAEAEAAPAPDPATLADGVYATKLT